MKKYLRGAILGCSRVTIVFTIAILIFRSFTWYTCLLTILRFASYVSLLSPIILISLFSVKLLHCWIIRFSNLTFSDFNGLLRHLVALLASIMIEWGMLQLEPCLRCDFLEFAIFILLSSNKSKFYIYSTSFF